MNEVRVVSHFISITWVSLSLLNCSKAPVVNTQEVKTKEDSAPVQSKPSALLSPKASASVSTAPTVKAKSGKAGTPHNNSEPIRICHYTTSIEFHAEIPSTLVWRNAGEQATFALPKKDEFSLQITPSISFSTGTYDCKSIGPNGVFCADKDYWREIDDIVNKRAVANAARPNYNTGKPELDSVRLIISNVEKFTVKDGKCVSFQVTKPEGLQGPYQELSEVYCGIHRKGDQGWLSVHALTNLPDSPTYVPLMKKAMESIIIDKVVSAKSDEERCKPEKL